MDTPARAEEQGRLVEKLKDHAAGQAGEIEDLKDEPREAHRGFAGLQARMLGDPGRLRAATLLGPGYRTPDEKTMP